MHGFTGISSLIFGYLVDYSPTVLTAIGGMHINDGLGIRVSNCQLCSESAVIPTLCMSIVSTPWHYGDSGSHQLQLRGAHVSSAGSRPLRLNARGCPYFLDVKSSCS